MLLTESEIQQVLEQVKTAFPHFTNWEYNNEEHEYYLDFSVWGEFVINPREIMPRHFFVTFYSTQENEWRGSLTIGKHSYYWSSADVGDADLLDTEACKSLEQAIAELKTKMVELFKGFSAI